MAHMRHLMSSGESAPHSDSSELLELKVRDYNQNPGTLTDYDCPECANKGTIAFVRDGEIRWKNCSCMEKRRYLREIRKSGLSEMLTRYTLDNWQCRELWQQNLLGMVKRYAEHPEGWLCLSGTPGTGKSHLCTALCGILMEKGFSVRYAPWKDIATKAKSVITDEDAYSALTEPLKRVRVLYIDDFWKTGRAVDRATGKRIPAAPTVGDVNFAFDIINARYADSRLLTILSTEMTLGEMLNVDEATGSRIVERTKGGGYQSLAGRQNWRLVG